MVKVILRDDDINHHCTPVDIAPFYAASDVFDEVVLCLVPKADGNARVGSMGSRYTSYVDNRPLVLAVKTLLEKGNVSIGMHGYAHAGYGEFRSDVDIQSIKEGKASLEDAFGVRVDTFTPPNNTLSKSNYHKIQAAGFTRILSAFSNWPWERPLRFSYFKQFILSSLLAISGHKAHRVMIPLRDGTVSEYCSFMAYNEQEVEELFEVVRSSYHHGVNEVVIATHYWEIWKSCPDKLLGMALRLRSL